MAASVQQLIGVMRERGGGPQSAIVFIKYFIHKIEIMILALTRGAVYVASHCVSPDRCLLRWVVEARVMFYRYKPAHSLNVGASCAGTGQRLEASGVAEQWAS